MPQMPWRDVWQHVASELDKLWATGQGHLVTEDVVRFATVKSLVSHGCQAHQLEIEWRRSEVPDAIDLVIKHAPHTAIEFKYPREPRVQNAAWSTHLGEVLRDYYRLAHAPAHIDDRLCVQLFPPPFRHYLAHVANTYGFELPHKGTTELRSEVVNALPKTVRQPLLPWMENDPRSIRASSIGSYSVGEGLLLSIHLVEPADAP